MELSIGDFIDRHTIVALKRRHLGEVKEEWEEFEEEFVRLNTNHPEWQLRYYFTELLGVNSKIWEHESDLRLGQLEKYDTSQLTHLSQEKLLQLAAVGLSAIKIRNANRKRKQLVNELVKLTGQGYKEIKINHASEEIVVEQKPSSGDQITVVSTPKAYIRAGEKLLLKIKQDQEAAGR